VSNASTWTPDKPAAAFSDEEVKETPAFSGLRDLMPVGMAEETILKLARDNIEARWVTIRDNRRNELVEEFVSTLLVCDPELATVSQILINRSDEEGLSVEFKRERAPRWKEETYAEHVGSYEKEYTSSKHPDASGIYKLDIERGRTEGEPVFMRLTQPNGRILQFPPVDAKSPVEGEVSSISRLLRDSTHKTTLSVWQYFGLKRAEETPEGERSDS